MKEYKPVFIVGCYRSGTSLLRLILNSHSKIYIPEETSFIPIIGIKINDYGDLSKRPHLEKLVSDILYFLAKKQKWTSTPKKDQVLALLPEVPVYSDVIQAVITCSAGNRDSEMLYWGDKTPIYSNSILYINNLFPNAKFISVIRDGRDVAASVKKEPFWGGRTPLFVAEEWMTRTFNAYTAKEVIGHNRFLTVRYEDLVSEPKNTITDIVKYLGLDFEDSMLSSHEGDSAKSLSRHSHHPNVVKPITNKSVGSYKRILTRSEREVFEREAGSVLKILEYDFDVSIATGVMPIERLFDYISRLFRGGAYRIYLIIKRMLKR